ncbi:hypothetical protein BBO99_00000974 [Phytophthora kernoviae]|uniref:PDZ domain-containing protein n=2 Tax=Phytophthora kernoviae TaxID=325452 RepID=A0A3R7KNV2_9STRA|nr:hypothetical protein G195_003064 [Phytophthora kernoviae 00238/432]KAG2529931.1 hypothetical protein JM16_001732 [Phytophthora kernoviae]KAG2531750.1 hypothetical protein JM18_001000 [Phytophthora kernoviae]RLN46493.1 hypothetical protein BBI17_000876 [Phytophthora kernoviae]RLN84817.1 hypothetical protein BBO99_00000974 [Phytophthora kernoviae]
MGESLTVRLFVRTQTYDIPCDPRQPAKWLLQQAKTIQHSSQKISVPEDELEVLFNRTSRQVVDLEDSIGSSISAMDVIDARTLLQTPDTSYNSAMFPWLRSYPGGLQMAEKMESSNGLFFQQLYAFTLIGKRTPVSASQRKQKHDKDNFLSLLQTYVMGNYDEDHKARPQTVGAVNGRYMTSQTRAGAKAGTSTSMYVASSRENQGRGVRRATAPSSPGYKPEHDPNGFSDSGSDSSMEDSSAYPTRSSLTHAPASPVQVPMVSSPSVLRPNDRNPLDKMDNVFDIVFKQQAIGMKLGADETKQFAIVKECFEGSEAKRYPEIQSGVVILAVNGQEVSGLGLSRVLYRLREAPRPVVVRFGRMSTRQLLERRKARGPW